MKNALFKTIITISIASCALVLSSCVKEEVSSKESSEESSMLPPYLTPEIIEKAEQYEYNFNPENVVIKQKETYDYTYSELVNLEAAEERNNHYLVFYFEGCYQDGFEEAYYGHAFLWDDGLYNAIFGETLVKGYWYNSSLSNGYDTTNSKDVKDCLVLVSNQENYEEITATSYTEEWRSYYDYRLTMRYPFSWGIRYIMLDGYYYYPDVALNFVDITIEQQLYEVNKYFSPRDFSDNLVRITKNLKAMYIFDYILISLGLFQKECLMNMNICLKRVHMLLPLNTKV